MADGSPSTAVTPAPAVKYPHITIQYCTQCKWMLRAAYFAQELLSTFSSTPLPPPPPPALSDPTTTTTTTAPQQFTLAAVTLQPSTGGIFIITLQHTRDPNAPHIIENTVIWDRKTDGGFPETKELKRRVRDVIDPGRGLGHVDKDYGTKKSGGEKRVSVVVGGGKGDGGEVKKEEGSGARLDDICIDCL